MEKKRAAHSTATQEFDLRVAPMAEDEVATEEFEFTADLVIELPIGVEPKPFFEYLVRIMIAHTEAYGGMLGGETKWHSYEESSDE